MLRNHPLVLVGSLIAGALLTGCAVSPAIPEGRSYPPSHLLAPRDVATRRSPENQGSAPLGDDASLQDYLAYAAVNNPGLEAAFRRWKAAMERMPQVTSLPDPKFQYAYFIEEVETRVGPQEQKFTLSQMFPWFGKLRLKGEMAARQAEAKWQSYQEKKLELFYEVKRAYAEYYFLGRSIEITADNLQLLKYLEEVAREAFRTGEGAHSDVVRAQVEIGKLEDRLESLREMKGPRAADLNAALGRPARADLPVPTLLPEEYAELSEDRLLTALQESNPRLKALGQMVGKAEAGV